jgi:hypothetical protein
MKPETVANDGKIKSLFSASKDIPASHAYKIRPEATHVVNDGKLSIFSSATVVDEQMFKFSSVLPLALKKVLG